jgi:hypothetical protein
VTLTISRIYSFDLDGSGRGLVEVLSWNLHVGTEENKYKS